MKKNSEQFIKKNKRSKLIRRSSLILMTMCLPVLLKMFVFDYIPMIGIVMAFQKYHPKLGIAGSPWVGFENFAFFFRSGNAQQALFNTIGMNLIFITTSTVFGVLFGLLMFEVTNKPFLRTIQTFMFIPYFISWTLVGIILGAFLDQNGIITKLMAGVTGNTHLFYSDTKGWRFIIAVLHLWKGLGVGGIIYYARMMSIDKELYEAALLDGAGRLKCARYITIPMLLPIIGVLTIMAFGNIVRSDFGVFYFATKNTPELYPVTNTIDTMVFRMLEGASFERSAAIGLFQSVVGFSLILTVNTIVRRINKQSALF